MDEKRRHHRKNYHQFVDYAVGPRSCQHAMSNISASGMLIRTRTDRPPVGAEINLDFELMEHSVNVAARVARHDLRGFGIEFLPGSVEEQSWIERMVEPLPRTGDAEYPMLEQGPGET